jgi:hypothetical protein
MQQWGDLLGGFHDASGKGLSLLWYAAGHSSACGSVPMTCSSCWHMCAQALPPAGNSRGEACAIGAAGCLSKPAQEVYAVLRGLAAPCPSVVVSVVLSAALQGR